MYVEINHDYKWTPYPSCIGPSDWKRCKLLQIGQSYHLQLFVSIFGFWQFAVILCVVLVLYHFVCLSVSDFFLFIFTSLLSFCVHFWSFCLFFSLSLHFWTLCDHFLWLLLYYRYHVSHFGNCLPIFLVIIFLFIWEHLAFLPNALTFSVTLTSDRGFVTCHK